jgi:oligosaccharide 4-alpha-D-glucosyltransferase
MHFKRLCVAIGLVLTGHHGFCQQAGVWTYTSYPNQIVKLEWTHPRMVKNEYLGEAVVAPQASKPVQINEAYITDTASHIKTSSSNLAGALLTDIKRKDAGLLVRMGHTELEILSAFDLPDKRGFRFRMNPHESWFGGGERTLPMKRNGQRIDLYNTPHYGYELMADRLNYSVPFVLSTAGYGLLFENPSKGFMDFGKTTPNELEVGFSSGNLNVYIIPGKTPKQILQAYFSLTGTQPLPPRWALGNFVSRFGYRNEAEVKEVVQRMQTDRFPMDALVIDIFWFGDSIKGTLGNLEWVNKTAWPNPRKMMADLKKENIKTILVTEPFFLKGTRQFEKSLPYLAKDSMGNPFMLTDFYFGYGGLIDLFRPDARQWFWQFYRQQNMLGAGGWWGDLGEPEKHPSGIYHDLSYFGITRKMGADEVHNLYGHMWTKMVYENWKKDHPEKRLFFLNRAGYAGSQRYSIFPWTGDVSRTWNGLKAQLPNLQSMSLSGIPYIHSDAGGFSNVPDNDQELYVRWVQMAAFTPVFRPHGTAVGPLEKDVNHLPSEPTYKEEPYKTYARQSIQLRYRLLPYLYTQAWQHTAKGTAIIRPLFYADVADSNLMLAQDQFMCGDALLVSPVLEKGATHRTLYLPKGGWYDWHRHNYETGGVWKKVSVQMDKLPLYVKSGSVVPIWPANNPTSTAAYNPSETFTLRWFAGPSADTSFLYDDDGADPDALHKPGSHQLLACIAYLRGNEYRIDIVPYNWPAKMKRAIHFQIAGLEYLRSQGFAKVEWLVNGMPQPITSLKSVAEDNTELLMSSITMEGKPIQLILRK